MSIPFILPSVKPSVVKLQKELVYFFPELTHFYGYAGTPDHNTKRCLDAMVYDSSGKYVAQQGRTNLPYSQRIALGDRVLAFLRKNAGHYHLNGVIWNRHVYGFPHDDAPSGRNHYRGPYNTARPYTQTAHDDHLHIDQDGRDFDSLIPAGPVAPPVVTPVPPVKLPTYYVDPAKVATSLWAVNHATGVATYERAPRFAITTAKEIVTVNGKKWVLTEAGYRYALDYLTTTKPAPATPPPAVKIPTHYVDPTKVETFLWSVRHATGETVHQRPPRFAITTGVKFVTVNGSKWLLTEAGYRYHTGYLTTTKPAPGKPTQMTPFHIPLREWGGAAGRTYIQGLRVHQPSGTRIVHQADDVAGQVEQDVVFRFHNAANKYLGAITVDRAGHSSSVGLESTGATSCNLWLGHDRYNKTGYVTWKVGQTGTATFKAVDSLPYGDPAIDQAADLICIRNGDRYRGYRFSAAKAGKAEKLWDFTIPAWGERFQGHLVYGGRLYVHRDVKTKGDSRAHMYDYTGKLLDSIDTRGMGDEAEGFVEIAGAVGIVKRTGGNDASRYVQVTPWK